MTRELLSKLDDTGISETWGLLSNGHEVRSRAQSLSDVMFSHWYQHRGPLEGLSAAAPPRRLSSRGPSDNEPPLFVQKAQSA